MIHDYYIRFILQVHTQGYSPYCQLWSHRAYLWHILYLTLTQFVQSTIFSTSGSYRSSIVCPRFWLAVDRGSIWKQKTSLSIQNRFTLKTFPWIVGRETKISWLIAISWGSYWKSVNFQRVCVCVCCTWGWSWYVANNCPRGSAVFEPSQLFRRISSVMKILIQKYRICVFSIWKMKQIANT